jgi:thiol-disulfide isomerase/thioredoxin
MTGVAKPAWLGIAMQPAAAGSGGGVLASQVTPRSPAERAGLQAGDRLVRVAGNPVATPTDVQRAVAARAPGDFLVVVYERAGKEATVRVELAERPSAQNVARQTYVGSPAPSLVGLLTVNGPALTTDGLRNRVVVLDFWAVWCGPCRMSLPVLSALQARYGPQGLSVLSITTDPAENAAKFARELQLRTSIIVDPEGTTTRAYGVSVLPTTFVVDRKGVVREVALGYEPSQDARIESLVKELLAEPGLPPAAPPAVSDAGARSAKRDAGDGGK